MNKFAIMFAFVAFGFITALNARIVPDNEIFFPLTEDEKANWNDFQTRHLLEPVGSQANYLNWNRAEWNNFLKGRIPSDYGTKNVNSFIISTPAAVRDDIAKATLRHDAGNNLWWSTRTFSIYVMNRVGTTYDAYRCGSLYFLAGVDTSKFPVHYHAQSTSRPATGSLPLNLGACTKIM